MMLAPLNRHSPPRVMLPGNVRRRSGMLRAKPWLKLTAENDSTEPYVHDQDAKEKNMNSKKETQSMSGVRASVALRRKSDLALWSSRKAAQSG